MHISLVIGADHRGYELKEFLKKQTQFSLITVSWIDVGAPTSERSDYPVFAVAAVHEMQQQQAHGGVLLCGTAVGMAITANRFAGIYAAVVWKPEIARLAKEDDNANMIALPADYLTQAQTFECVREWLSAQFKEGRYKKRIELIDAIK
ncbi:MAG: Ribose-5-phosphate isomerase B [Candidatus Dependentiae bacterium ADurb.Bin331]|nr:MAG: Ribose-5-phosphate isomerase B [Candidatus Dependentiae bacterium ADurb.Bin331]